MPAFASSTDRPIALIGIASEMESICQRLVGSRSERRPWGQLVVGRWPQSAVTVAAAEIAIGKVGAAMGAQGLIDAIQPRVLINCGSAGALAGQMGVGDLVLADRVMAHDQGIYLPPTNGTKGQRDDGFVPGGSSLPQGRRRGFLPSGPLLERACAALEQGLPAQRLHVGTVVSGDQLIFQSEWKRWLRDTFEAIAVDNEGVAVAQVAHCHNLPWLLLRGISDNADSTGGFDFTSLVVYQDDEVEPTTLSQVRQRLHQEMRQPGTWQRARRFKQGVDRAMAAVVLALTHLLPQL